MNDPPLLIDSLCVQGVNSPSKTMAVGSSGQLIFKKSGTELLYYDTQEHSITTMKLSRLDPLYDDCQIFDLAFCRNGQLIVCLQRPTTGEFFVCEGHIDTQENVVDISGKVHRTDIFASKGKNVILLEDEAGAVLASMPIRFHLNSRSCIELFHVSTFLTSGTGAKYIMNLQNVDNFTDSLSCPFISRNHLYLFPVADYSRFLLIPLSGTSCGKAQIRSTSGEIPSREFLNKTVQVYEDYALLYVNQSQFAKVDPCFYVLNLTNLRWSRTHLSLSSHYPNGKISLQKASENSVFLHGDCNLASCSLRTHLYLVNVETVSQMLSEKRYRSPSVSSMYCTMRPSTSESQKQSTKDAGNSVDETALSDFATSQNARSRLVAQRYRKKQLDNDHQLKKRYSASKNSVSSSTSNSWESDVGGNLKRSPSVGSVNWSADMVDQCAGSSLDEQLRMAIDWGFNQSEILAALKANNKENREEFPPFESPNVMLDLLNQVSGRTMAKLSIYQPLSDAQPHSSRRHDSPRSASVSRSSSFHLGTPKSTRESHDIVRLLSTLEREKERDRKEVESQFIILKNRINVLEIEKEGLVRDNKELRRIVDSTSELLQKEQEDKEKLLDDKAEYLKSFDKMTLQHLRSQQELHDQKELSEHRRKIYEEEQSKKEEQLQSLQLRSEELEKELERKSALLDEQTNITRRMEERTSQLQSVVLLENLTKKYEKLLEFMSLFAPNFEDVRTAHKELFATYPQMQDALQREREERQREKLEMQEMAERHMREYNRLVDKSIAECCICLSTKPSVVFMPCRHLVSCHDCHAEIKECPTCRAVIEDHINVYL